jgi:hypothetical protein
VDSATFRSKLRPGATIVFAMIVVVLLVLIAFAALNGSTSDPIVGDWRVTYGSPSAVTMSLSNGRYTETAKTPVQVVGASCSLPAGTVIATFESTAPQKYSGRHGLWFTNNCLFARFTPISLTLSGDHRTLSSNLNATFVRIGAKSRGVGLWPWWLLLLAVATITVVLRQRRNRVSRRRPNT